MNRNLAVHADIHVHMLKVNMQYLARYGILLDILYNYWNSCIIGQLGLQNSPRIGF
ncbi:hypothetical protein D3C75_1047580 [compost metagenome]